MPPWPPVRYGGARGGRDGAPRGKRSPETGDHIPPDNVHGVFWIASEHFGPIYALLSDALIYPESCS